MQKKLDVCIRKKKRFSMITKLQTHLVVHIKFLHIDNCISHKIIFSMLGTGLGIIIFHLGLCTDSEWQWKLKQNDMSWQVEIFFRFANNISMARQQSYSLKVSISIPRSSELPETILTPTKLPKYKKNHRNCKGYVERYKLRQHFLKFFLQLTRLCRSVLEKIKKR